MSAPKQTETTQRWEFVLAVGGIGAPCPTGLEASRRAVRDGIEFGPIDPELVRLHRISPFMASHYGAEEAFLQRVEASATRRQTQIRDVFDLHLLLGSGCDVDRTEPRMVRFGAQAARNALWRENG